MPPATSASDQPAIRAAALVADRAAEAAGVRIESVVDAQGVDAAGSVFNEVWGHRDSGGVLPDDVLRMFVLTGQYLVLAKDSATDVPLAASAGILAEPVGAGLHSHVTGVLPAGLGRGLGYAVKLHQRVWALERGLREIGWTYDPLIRRNAHFNLTKLGAEPERYLANFYGEMTDALNAGDESDRLLVHWRVGDDAVETRLEAPAHSVLSREVLCAEGFHLVLAEGPDGAPVSGKAMSGSTALSALGRQVLIGTPRDVEGLRRVDPDRAAQWRRAQREAFMDASAAGLGVIGFTREGDYVLGPRSRHPLGAATQQTSEVP